MKLAFLADALHWGGAEILANRWAEALVAHGDECLWIGPSASDAPMRSIPIDLGGLRVARWRGTNLISPAFWRNAVRARRALREIVRIEKIDVLIVQQDLGTRVVAALAAPIPGCQRIVLIEHSRLHGWVRKTPVGGVYRWATKRCGGEVVAVADAVAADLQSIGVPTAGIRVIRNGAPTHDLPAGDKTRLVTWSRVVPRKGIDRLIEIVAALKVDDVQVECLVIGDGPDLPRLRKLAADLQVENQIQFTGFVQEPLSLVTDADIFVSLSRDPGEGLPLRALEAMGASLPIVVTDVGGTVEAVTHGTDGFVVQVGDEASAGLFVRELLRDPDFKRRIGQAARGRVDSYTNADALRAFTDFVAPDVHDLQSLG